MPRYDYVAQLARMQAAEARQALAEAKRQEIAQRRQQHQAHLDYQAQREQEVEQKNSEIATRINALNLLLQEALTKRDYKLDFGALKTQFVRPPFNPEGLQISPPAPDFRTYFPKEPNPLVGWVPAIKKRYEGALQVAKNRYQSDLDKYKDDEKNREARLAQKHLEYDAECARQSQVVAQQNQDVDTFEKDYREHKPAAVTQYFSMIFDKDHLPEGFPMKHRIGYLAESRQIVIERDFPNTQIVPQEASFRYVKKSDKIESTSRPNAQARDLYSSIVSQFALRSLYVAVMGDEALSFDTIVLNCFVDSIDPANGQPIRPCLLTVRVTRDRFLELNLSQVDPAICLNALNAQVSRSPHELMPVKPIVDFNMVDPRFIQKSDILSSLDSRPNLAELSPTEFEFLITNLFEKMGLETRQPRMSQDGGVDCVAWDMRPVVGGKVVIQAKRYKHTVGVSATRDLYGTMLNEGASKGILVTTSGYGKASYTFADNKPLQLITGGELLYLLKEHTGVDARIEFPESWVDPVPDTASEEAVETLRNPGIPSGEDVLDSAAAPTKTPTSD